MACVMVYFSLDGKAYTERISICQYMAHASWGRGARPRVGGGGGIGIDSVNLNFARCTLYHEFTR